MGEALGDWAAHEQPDGWLEDPVLGPLAGTYGVGMTGQTMVEAGDASGNEALIVDALRSEVAEVEHPEGGSFELLALAEAYDWNQAHLAQAPAWVAVQPTIAAFLGEHRSLVSDAGSCFTVTGCYDNLKLVAAVGDLALLRTGLTSFAPGALLSDRPKLRGQAFAWLAAAARNTGEDARRVGSTNFTGAGILSDPSQNPLAYHALSTMMLGQAALALGAQAPRAVRSAFSRAARALLGLMAPDGNVTYIGRGQGQVWTVGATVDALAIAAELAPTPAWRGRYLAGVTLALEHLETAYPLNGWGFPLVPRLADDAQPNYLGIDGYANTVEYNGLTLWALQKAATTLAHIPAAPAGAVPSDTDGVFLDPSHARFATVTDGKLWLAIHATDSNPGDARYGFGLVAAELRTADGWRSVLPSRPLTSTAQVGGVAILNGGRQFYPIGERLSANARGRITIHGKWGTADGSHKLSHGTVWSYLPTPRGNGVTLTLHTLPRRTYRLQVWYLPGAQITTTGERLSVSEPDGTSQTYSFNLPVSISDAGTFHSAYAEKLDSDVITLAPGRSRLLKYTTTLR